MKFFIILTFFQFSSFAFTLTNSGRVNLPGPEVTVVVAGNTCTNAGFNSANELAEMVQESLDDYWNRVPTCALELEVSGVDSSVDSSNDNLSQLINKAATGQILVGCSDDATTFASSGTLGVGSINTVNGDRGVFLINNRHTTFAELSAQEKLATIAHEMGHAFGLGHSADEAALMYYSIGGKIQDNLSQDDYDGCSYLYPHDSPGSCSAVIPVLPNSDDSGSGGGRRFIWIFLFGIFLSLAASKRPSLRI